jgi:hypothetical protein
VTTERHDFTNPGWGHALHIRVTDKEKGILKGTVHSATGMAKGDEIYYEVELGHNVAKVIKCKKFHDPQDMWAITVQVTERIPHKEVNK